MYLKSFGATVVTPAGIQTKSSGGVLWVTVSKKTKTKQKNEKTGLLTSI